MPAPEPLPAIPPVSKEWHAPPAKTGEKKAVPTGWTTPPAGPALAKDTDVPVPAKSKTPMIVQDTSTCVGECIDIPRPSLRDRLQSWFAPRPTKPAPVIVVEGTTPAPRASEKSLAIATPPAPPQAEVIVVAKDDCKSECAEKVTVPAQAAVQAVPVARPRKTAPARVVEKTDILTSPERFNPPAERLQPRGTLVQAPAAAPAAVEVTQTAPTSWPMGSQSVLSARSGVPGPVSFVPVPVVTVPQPWRPPVPPDPKTPEAPQLNAFVNAFTPPPNPRPRNPGIMPAGPQAVAYNPMMMPGAPYGYNPYLANPAMMNPAMMQAMMAQRMAYGYPAPPAQYQGSPMDASRNYNGPQPPNPFGTGAPQAVQPAGYYFPQQMPAMQQMPMMPPQMPVMQAGYATAGRPSAEAQIAPLVNLLRDSPYPAERERAAGALAALDWQAHPEILQALLHAATQDPAGSVRAGCVHQLGRMGARTEPVRTTLNHLRTDSDPRVREQVEQAMGRLGAAAN
jgi:hypothetical protein